MRRLTHLSTIIADLGDIFVFVAPVTCVPLVVAVLFSEWTMLLPMAAVPFIFFASGIVLRSIPRSERGVRLSTALCSVALFWFFFATWGWTSPMPFSKAWRGGQGQHFP